ncbi:MAG: hypothetical protein WBA46_06420 [Thermomicrobiales bacterium]
MRRRPDTPEQQIPGPIQPTIDHDGIDWPREVHAPLDADRMCLAVARARHYHLLRVAGSEDAVSVQLRNEIIGQPAWYPSALADGWWDIGSVSDVHDGGLVSMRVRWHPEQDRVRLERPPARPGGETEPDPISAGYRLGDAVARDGYIYTWQGHDYPPADAAALVDQLRSTTGWTWRPGVMIRVTITPNTYFPKGYKRNASAQAIVHPAGPRVEGQPKHIVPVVPKPGRAPDLAAVALMRIEPFEVDAPSDIWEWERGRIRDWTRAHLRRVVAERRKDAA